MLYTYPDNIGYVNNKKGFSSVTTAGRTVCYILGTQDDGTNTGKRLIIRTYSAPAGGTLIETQSFAPVLPYRIMINDKTLLNYSNRRDILKANASDLNLYNPGIDFNVVDSASGCWPSELPASTRFIELNLTRKCFPVMGLPKDWSYEMQQTLNYGKLKIKPTTLEGYDLQASMVAESSGDNDFLYLTIVSRVDMRGSYSNNNSTWNDFKWNWSIPIFIKLVVDRTTLDTNLRGSVVDISPTSWSYPIDSNWFDSDSKVTIGKINTAITSTPTTKLWNYNVIPSRGVNNTGTSLTGFTTGRPPSTTSFLIPASFGCLADIYTQDSSNILCFTSIGNYYPIEGKYKQVHTLSKMTRSTTGFNVPANRNSQEQTIELSARNAVYKTGAGVGDYYIALINFYDTDRVGINVLIYNYDFYLVAQFKMFHVRDADLVEKAGSVYLMLYGIDAMKIYKFPTADATFISRIGKTSSTALGNGGEKFLTDTGMILVASSSLSPIARSLADFKPIGSSINYKLDTKAQDKSIDVEIFSGTSNHLRLIGTGCVAVDKITLASTGQSNKLQYWTI